MTALSHKLLLLQFLIRSVELFCLFASVMWLVSVYSFHSKVYLEILENTFTLTHRGPIQLASPSIKETTRDILEKDS